MVFESSGNRQVEYDMPSKRGAVASSILLIFKYENETASYSRTIRSILTFLFCSGYFNHDISHQVDLPFPEYPAPRLLTRAEYQELLQTCCQNIRDTDIMRLLLLTGIRLSELTSISLFEVQLTVSGTPSRFSI
jgi:site-specific recombinase XerD